MSFKISVEILTFGKINHKLSDILESKAVANGTSAKSNLPCFGNMAGFVKLFM